MKYNKRILKLRCIYATAAGADSKDVGGLIDEIKMFLHIEMLFGSSFMDKEIELKR